MEDIKNKELWRKKSVFYPNFYSVYGIIKVVMDNDFSSTEQNQNINKNEKKEGNLKFNVVESKKSTLDEPLTEKPVSKKMFLVGLIAIIAIIITVGIGAFFIGKDAGQKEASGEGESEIIADAGEVEGYDYDALYDKLNKSDSEENNEKLIEETFAELEKSEPTEDKNEQAKRLVAKADAFMYVGMPRKALELVAQASDMNVEDWYVKVSVCSSGINAAGEVGDNALYEKYQGQCQELFAGEPAEGGEGGGD